MEADDSTAQGAPKGHSFVIDEISQEEQHMKTVETVPQDFGQLYGVGFRKLVYQPTKAAGTIEVEAHYIGRREIHDEVKRYVRQTKAGLLAPIKRITCGKDDEQYKFWNTQVSLKQLDGLVQVPTETLATISKRLDTQFAMTEPVYGSLNPTKCRDQPTTEQAVANEN